jgi:S1-C subfamily serine protease
MGRSHAAGFFPREAVTDHRRGLVFELKNSHFGPGLPARFRLLATADPLSLEAEPIPAIVRCSTDGPPPATTGPKRLPSPYALFDEKGKFSATEQEEAAAASLVKSGGFHGLHAVKITPGGRFRAPLDQIVRIRREPAEGEFRYLRFAFRKYGGGRLSLELEQPIVTQAQVRYDAGHGGPCYGPAKKIWRPGLPSEWIVSEHDLFAEWGRTDISALTIGTPDGEHALVDYVYVARTREDFAAVPDVPPMAEVNQRARRGLAAPVTSKVEHAVVTVSVEGRRGTGVIVGSKGIVLTAGHLLVGPGREATVHVADGRTLKAKTLGVARDYDLGAVKIDSDAPIGVEMSGAKQTPPHRLYVGFASMSSAESGPRIGSYIADIAREDRHTFEADFFMPDSLVGGPLFDEQTQLVGVHTVRSPRGNMQFTRVSDHDLADVWRRLTAGEVWGKWLAGSGPVFGVVTTGVAGGCRVDGVVSGSPAAGGGMKVGDIIEQVEGRRVANYLEIGDVLADKDPGDEVTIKIRRDEEQRTLRLRLVPRQS